MELENFVSANRMTFDNPEIQTLMEELKRRLKNVRDREGRVAGAESLESGGLTWPPRPIALIRPAGSEQ